jgi:hypothetical protein
MLLKTLAVPLGEPMKVLSKATKSDTARAEPRPGSLPERVRKLLADATYEPPKVITFPTDKMTKLTPVTMMGNLT